MKENQYTIEPLLGIRKNSLLLLMAYEYLCEDTFLLKIGKDIENNLQTLKEDISSLKKQFPGKLTTEIDPGDILENIGATAQALIKSGEEVQDRCMSGELGRALESDVKTITSALNQIRIQVLGKDLSYTRKDSVFNLFSRLQDMANSLGSKMILAAKILLCMVILLIAAFLYLLFTMEKQGPLMEEVEASRAFISSNEKSLSQLEVKREEISKEIKALEKKDMNRGEKIALLDLEMEIRKMNQDHDTMEAEIATHEKKIAENLKRAENIKETSFLNRLLRR
jgi:hypothetical protein